MKFVIKSLSGWRWMSPPVWGRGLKSSVEETARLEDGRPRCGGVG